MDFLSDTDPEEPIDIVEELAEINEWAYERFEDDQIIMVISGAWQNYSVTIADCKQDDTLRLICAFSFEASDEHKYELYELMNLINNRRWVTSFSFDEDEELIVGRCSVLVDEVPATATMISRMILDAVGGAEQYYPALQLVGGGDMTAQEAMQTAVIQETYGRA